MYFLAYCFKINLSNGKNSLRKTLMRKKFLFSKNFYEKRAWQVKELVCGIDEVGRGCLAGPVVAAAVILYPNSKHKWLKDSKLLEKDELIKAYDWIIKNSWYSVCPVSHVEIDKVNIWNATLMAMRQASLNLFFSSKQVPSVVLVDAMPVSFNKTAYESVEIQYFIEGERHSTSIAAASIVAKVTRDRMMAVYDTIFPAYKFAQHKGYSTKLHQDSIRSAGRSIIHRDSFLKKFELKENQANEEQKSLFC